LKTNEEEATSALDEYYLLFATFVLLLR